MSSSIQRNRIRSIDMMRGLVMLIMLIDHVRERFFLHLQVSDPMDIDTTSPALFYTRLAAHYCAPTFVFLTGLSAWLYANPMDSTKKPKPRRNIREFLIKRGLFILFLEVTFITFSWGASFHILYLQVMWAIGISMIALALLSYLPRYLLLFLGLVIVFGHNALTSISYVPHETGYTLWTMLHDRGYIYQSAALNIKVSYPVLPWIGVILLGYTCGPLYSQGIDKALRGRWLFGLFAVSLGLFLLLRGFNIYGETLPWESQQGAVETLMSLLNLTKYPPSLAFLLFTLAGMFLLLFAFERVEDKRLSFLDTFGSVPMFFYILHLYVLLAMYGSALAIWGANKGKYVGVDHIYQIWLIAVGLGLLLYIPVKWFSAYKSKHRSPWLKYL
ncbi:DUF1624 domain-containing protein [Alteromonas sp. S015]|uniref:DUF1624 domain-containing protein n=1 Tax=Alteromonas sp. S015 TaxID=3117401 RepID=UPI002FE12C94